MAKHVRTIAERARELEIQTRLLIEHLEGYREDEARFRSIATVLRLLVSAAGQQPLLLTLSGDVGAHSFVQPPFLHSKYQLPPLRRYRRIPLRSVELMSEYFHGTCDPDLWRAIEACARTLPEGHLLRAYVDADNESRGQLEVKLMSMCEPSGDSLESRYEDAIARSDEAQSDAILQELKKRCVPVEFELWLRDGILCITGGVTYTPLRLLQDVANHHGGTHYVDPRDNVIHRALHEYQVGCHSPVGMMLYRVGCEVARVSVDLLDHLSQNTEFRTRHADLLQRVMALGDVASEETDHSPNLACGDPLPPELIAAVTIDELQDGSSTPPVTVHPGTALVVTRMGATITAHLLSTGIGCHRFRHPHPKPIQGHMTVVVVCGSQTQPKVYFGTDEVVADQSERLRVGDAVLCWLSPGQMRSELPWEDAGATVCRLGILIEMGVDRCKVAVMGLKKHLMFSSVDVS